MKRVKCDGVGDDNGFFEMGAEEGLSAVQPIVMRDGRTKPHYGLLREPVEEVTKAVLFEDCGSTQDWKDNLNIGVAACAAYRPTLRQHCRFWRNDALEAAAKVCERYGQHDAARDIRALMDKGA